MGRHSHKWSAYFNILNKLANKSNKTDVCKACQEALGSEAKNLTNKANLCYNHLKLCGQIYENRVEGDYQTA